MKKHRMKNKFPELDEPGRFGTKFYDFEGKVMTIGQWSTMTEARTQVLGKTYVRGQGKVYRISTVLLGIDYSFGSAKKPVIFERYSTIQQARKGHRNVVRGMRRMLTERNRMYGPLLNNGRKS